MGISFNQDFVQIGNLLNGLTLPPLMLQGLILKQQPSKYLAFKCLELEYLGLQYLKALNMNIKAFEIKISYQWSIITIQALVDVDQSKRQA